MAYASVHLQCATREASVICIQAARTSECALVSTLLLHFVTDKIDHMLCVLSLVYLGPECTFEEPFPCCATGTQTQFTIPNLSP